MKKFNDLVGEVGSHELRDLVMNYDIQKVQESIKGIWDIVRKAETYRQNSNVILKFNSPQIKIAALKIKEMLSEHDVDMLELEKTLDVLKNNMNLVQKDQDIKFIRISSENIKLTNLVIVDDFSDKGEEAWNRVRDEIISIIKQDSFCWKDLSKKDDFIEIVELKTDTSLDLAHNKIDLFLVDDMSKNIGGKVVLRNENNYYEGILESAAMDISSIVNKNGEDIIYFIKIKEFLNSFFIGAETIEYNKNSSINRYYFNNNGKSEWSIQFIEN